MYIRFTIPNLYLCRNTSVNIIEYLYHNKPPMNQYLNLNCPPTPQHKQKEKAPAKRFINVEQLLSPKLKLKLLVKMPTMSIT